jgi:hypothetical protein
MSCGDRFIMPRTLHGAYCTNALFHRDFIAKVPNGSPLPARVDVIDGLPVRGVSFAVA